MIHENTQFLSSVVIGGAGLIATSLYQWNNSKMAQQQAVWQQHREEEKADNDWRIERAKILAQNLPTLTTRGKDTVEQRYGVLLSLTHGKIMERDLAVSYALELGKDSPEDMRSVLANIEQKDTTYYKRLAEAYVPTCMQKYGVAAPSMYVCRKDSLAGFSQGIAGALADDLIGVTDPASSAPVLMLADDRYVHGKLMSLLGLFNEYVTDVYERRQWPVLERVQNSSTGAQLVASIDLLMQSLDQANTSDRAAIRKRFEAAETWLKDYIAGPACDGECRGRMLGIILSNLGQSPEFFTKLLRELLAGERQEVAPFISRLQGRITYCQIEPTHIPALRDEVILPALHDQAAKPAPDQELLDEMLGLMLALPLPENSSPGGLAWKRLQEKLGQVTKGRQPQLFLNHYLEDQKRRQALLKASKQAKASAAPAPATTTAAPSAPRASTGVATGVATGGATVAATAESLTRGTNFCAALSQAQSQADDRDD